MSKALKLHLQVLNGHLRVLPKGKLNTQDVDLMLGTVRSGLTFFPVVVIDLNELREAEGDSLEVLGKGLDQLISDKKLVLSSERPHFRWRLQKPANSPSECSCRGNCRNCPCRAPENNQLRNQKAGAGHPRR